ncbi:protein trichome birefringence-like 19 [Lycium ferocissimum]|uniref:protein trichome birefringence-like 19 n=1 Tax=Lycium ferocissimum TaxID=112874 RepID=UPI002815387F|nr:protein trichome birefringence-like 19 [Lycium ferocissimum]
MELPFGKYSTSAQRFVLLVLAVAVLGLIPLYHPFNFYPADLVTRNPSEISPTYHAEEQNIDIKEPEKCDIFSGKWVWNPDAPYYTNMTCTEIHEHQNCMKYGRPDSDYLKWRWKPNGCELPIFNPFQFLEVVRNKSLAVVGDSVARNQMQSLICLLSRVEYPVDISDNPDQSFKKYKYATYNFTLAMYWSPFLVSTKEADADGPCHTGLYNLYLDEADEKWTTQIEGYDYVILNAGHWFAICSCIFENNQRVFANLTAKYCL